MYILTATSMLQFTGVLTSKLNLEDKSFINIVSENYILASFIVGNRQECLFYT